MTSEIMWVTIWTIAVLVLVTITAAWVAVAVWLGQMVYVRLATGHPWRESSALLRSRHRSRIRWLPGGFSHRKRMRRPVRDMQVIVGPGEQFTVPPGVTSAAFSTGSEGETKATWAEPAEDQLEIPPATVTTAEGDTVTFRFPGGPLSITGLRPVEDLPALSYHVPPPAQDTITFPAHDGGEPQ
jgi:hypothetical protein